jgi:hypothetical protein
MRVWQNPVARATVDAAAPNLWHARNVPAGHFCISASAERFGGATYSAPFDRKPGAPRTQVVLHIPQSTATLVTTLKNPSQNPSSQHDVELCARDQSVRLTITAVPLQPFSMKLPPGSYRVIDPATLLPRLDTPPIEIKNGESKALEIDLTPPPAKAAAMVHLSLWDAGGVLVTDVSSYLEDAANNTIKPDQNIGIGNRFFVPPGHYRAVMNRPNHDPTIQEFDVPPSNAASRSARTTTINMILPEEISYSAQDPR